ncbi:MAG: hypothetical protein OEW62_09520 [Candidatus Bathyarchaeota archaeon]|nr:hypothetical protein [Candidatus Bathyarchaeota archaeon]MDH5595924.1 hypothetical protein [Candidatus Bathyarchaeota archaeon]
MPETLEKIMKETGCCNTCNGCIECDCPKNRENGPRKLQVDMARVDYDLNLASGD